MNVIPPTLEGSNIRPLQGRNQTLQGFCSVGFTYG